MMMMPSTSPTLVKRRLTPWKLAKPCGDHLVGDAHLRRHADRGQRVLDIVPAGHRQVRCPRSCAPRHGGRGSTRRTVAAGHRHDILAAHVGLGGEAVGDDPPVAQARDDRLHLGMVDAEQGRAVEGHVLDELDEGVLHLLEAAIMIEMLGIDVGDHRDRAVEPQEAAVALVGLDHHPVGLAEPRVRAVGVDDAAVDHGRIDPAGVEHRRDHRGGGGLAVRARHRDGELEPHQLGQHLGPPHHRDAPLIGRDDLGIVLA